MARRPFYGQNDTKIAKMDMQAATAPGRAYAQMGKEFGDAIGGAIEKYQLNKEKREAEERTAMGNLAGFSPEELMEMKSRDPNLSKAIDNIQSDKASPKDFQLINASSAPYIAGRSRRLQEENAQIKNQLSKLNLDTAKILQLPKVRDAIAQYGLNDVIRDSQKQTIPSATAVKLATDKSTLKTLPSQTDATMSANRASEMQSDIMVADALKRGGPGGVAKEMEGDRDLKRRGLEADIRSKDSLSNFRDTTMQINLYNALNKADPSLADLYKAEINNQAELRKTKLQDPKEPGVELTYEEYLLKHEDDPERYPLDGNNPAARLHGAILNSMRLQDELLKTKGPQVLANVPDPAPTPVKPGLDYNLQDQALMDSQSTGVTFPQLYR